MRAGFPRGHVLSVAALAMLLTVPITARGQGAVAPPACQDPAYRQMDFWIGTWDSYDVSGHIQGRLRVERAYDGCVLVESWEGAEGDRGTSVNIYDATRKVWNETWVSNHGTLLTLEGNMAGRSMAMTGTHLGADGRPQLHRNVWTPTADGVHQVWDFSTDGGQTWQPMYDGMLRRVK